MRRKPIIWAVSILLGVSLAAQAQGKKCVGKPTNISGNVVAFDPVMHAASPVQGLFHEEDLIIAAKPRRSGEALKYFKVHIKTNRGFSLSDAAFSGSVLVQFKAVKCATSPETVPVLVQDTKPSGGEADETLIPTGRYALTEKYRGKFQEAIPISGSFCFKD